jgi:hypothetical protein
MRTSSQGPTQFRNSDQILSRTQSFIREARPTVSPPAPHPNATSKEVEEFLVGVFLVHSWDLSPREAEEIASRCPANGEGLYILQKSTMTQYYGQSYGEVIRATSLTILLHIDFEL